jgi:hypothetical protein
MKRLFKRFWQSLPLYSKKHVDQQWCDGFFRGLSSGRNETGLTRDIKGRFKKLPHD